MQSENRIQPLRIPGGWTIVFNKLEDMEPDDLDCNDRIWLFAFTQDILYMYADLSRKRDKRLEKQKLGIDLGWYPDGDPTGSFCLQAILNDNWETPLLSYSSRSKKEIVEQLEQWLFHEFMPIYFIEENIFRKNHF